MKRVVITGMSAICAAGSSHEEIFKSLCDKKIILKKLEKDTAARKNIKLDYYVPFPEIDDSEFAEKLKVVKNRGSRSSHAAAYTALRAVQDAGIENLDADTSVYVGAGAPVIEPLSEAVISFHETGRMNMLSIPMTMHNSAASWVTMVLGTHGRSLEVGTACASGTASIGLGYEDVAFGKCAMSVCGSSDCLADKDMTLIKGFEYLKAISSSKDGMSFPFSEERKGFMFSEGAAAMLVLEELEHAKKRNAKIYAEITGAESSSDAFSMVSMPEDGRNIKTMLKKLVGDKKIDYYNAHGTGTFLNDQVESTVIREIFGSKEEQPAISATKSILGHTLGASGALEAIVCVDTILTQTVHGSNCQTVMDDLNITAETREVPVDRAVSASFGFGGHNSALLIERYRESK